MRKRIIGKASRVSEVKDQLALLSVVHRFTSPRIYDLDDVLILPDVDAIMRRQSMPRVPTPPDSVMP